MFHSFFIRTSQTGRISSTLTPSDQVKSIFKHSIYNKKDKAWGMDDKLSKLFNFSLEANSAIDKDQKP